MMKIFLNNKGQKNSQEEKIAGEEIKKEILKVLKTHKTEGELSITFGDGELLRKINKKYRKKNKTTDVLSFNLGDEKKIMGDIYISIPAAKKQAKEYNVSLKDELLRLAEHGTLHVLGYTHKEMGL